MFTMKNRTGSDLARMLKGGVIMDVVTAKQAANRKLSYVEPHDATQ